MVDPGTESRRPHPPAPSKKHADEGTGEAKDQAAKTLDGLREQRKVASQKYDKLKQSGSEAWQQFKTELDKLVDNIQKGIEEAKAKIK